MSKEMIVAGAGIGLVVFILAWLFSVFAPNLLSKVS